ncbi:MAG: hypothetical protein K2W95_00860 [Candidatus Obscuribacterales bacterium]|nr:hypothetical protein [Candidatus Obscuribacterales bacterium]
MAKTVPIPPPPPTEMATGAASDPYEAAFQVQDSDPYEAAFMEQPAIPAMPGAPLAPAAAQPAPAKKKNVMTVTKPKPAPKQAAAKTLIAPPPPPSPGQEAADNIGKMFGGIPQAINQLGQQAQNVPFLGDLVKGAQQLGKEVQQPLDAALAGLAGIPAGIIGLPQALGNFDMHAAQVAKQKGLPYFSPTGAAMGVINPMLGRSPAAPIKVKENYQQIPFVEPFARRMPASTGLGEMVGGALIPALNPAIGLPAKGLLSNPMVHGAAEGALNAGAMGGVMDLGVQSGEQLAAKETKPLDFGRAAKAGAASAAVGTALGAGVGAYKGIKAKKAAEPAPAEPEVLPPDDVDAVVTQQEQQAQTGYVNPFDGITKGDTPAFQRTVEQEIKRATSPEELIRVTNDAYTWTKKHTQLDARQKINEAIKSQSKNQEGLLKQNAAEKTREELAALDKEREAARMAKVSADTRGGNLEVQSVNQESAALAAQKAPPPQPEIAPAQQATLDAEAAQRSQTFDRGQQENQEFPNSYRTFKDERGPIQDQWNARQLTDSQLDEMRDWWSIETQRESLKGSQKTAANQRMDALAQERMRRERRKNDGIEQDWPQDEPPFVDEPEATAPEPAATPEPAAPKTAPDDFGPLTDDELTSYVSDDYPDDVQLRAIDEMARRTEAVKPTDIDDKTLDTKPEEVAIVSAPEAQNVGQVDGQKPKYEVRKHPDKKNNFAIFNNETGQFEARSGKDRNQLQRTADSANQSGALGTRGTRTDRQQAGNSKAATPLAISDDASPTERKIFEGGTNVAREQLGDLAGGLDELATAVRAKADARAKLQAATAALGKAEGRSFFKLKKSQGYSADEQAFLKNAKLEDDSLYFEVNTDRPGADAEVSITGRQQGRELIQQFEAEYKAAEEAVQLAKGKVQAPLMAKVQAGELPASVNFESGGLPFNIRTRANRKLFNEKQFTLSEGETVPDDRQGMKEVDKWYGKLPPAEQTKVYEKAAVSTSPFRQRGIRSQRGAVNPLAILKPKKGSSGKTSPPPAVSQQVQGGQQIASVAMQAPAVKKAGLLQGAAEKTSLLSLRRTFDIVRDNSIGLHNRVWNNVAKEVLAGKGVKFKPGDEAFVAEARGMEAKDILTSPNLGPLTKQQRLYLSQSRLIRKESAKFVKEALDEIEKAPRTEWNHETGIQHDTLAQLYDGLLGSKRATNGTREANPVDQLTSGLYDYIFKWNPGYHALNLTDPLIAGSARVGIHRITAASAYNKGAGSAAGRKFVQELADGLDGPVKQFRKEVELSKGNGLLSKIRSLPDLPSLEWNNRDVMAAGLMLYADKVKYKGGGYKLIDDLATGNVADDVKVDAFVEALKVNQDVNGAGALGLDKDLIGRSPQFKGVIQFTSQPYRVARMLKKYAGDIVTGRDIVGGARSILTFAAMQTVLGGRAVIPTEVSQAWDMIEQPDAEGKKALYALQDLLDRVSVPRALGRDTADKMKVSLMPLFATGGQGSIAWETVTKIVTNLMSGEVDKAERSAGLLALSMLLGGGGGDLQKILKENESLSKGQKTYTTYSDIVQRPIGKKTDPNYDLGKAAGNVLLPGVPTDVGDFQKGARRKENKKNLMKLRKDK